MTTESYTGGCQCGAVRFRADLDLDTAIECNCSRCGRMGLKYAFTPTGSFALEAGEDATTEYRFNKHVISHRFCRTCGVEAYATGRNPDGTEMAAVNVGCLDGVDVFALDLQRIDGRGM